jgi:uncharacterized protein (DUF433 family)
VKEYARKRARQADSPARYDARGIVFAYREEMTVEQKTSLAAVVTIDQETMHGVPCFTGTRIPVQTLIDFLETGERIDDFLAVYQYIPRQQILAFLELSRDIAIDQLTCAS